MDVMSSISTAIEITKKLRDLGKKVSEADFKMMLADLTDQLGDAKLSAANVKIELASALGKIEELERQASKSQAAEPELHEGAYVFGDRQRHYCTGCYDGSSKKILLTEHTDDFKVFGKWFCPACKNSFGS